MQSSWSFLWEREIWERKRRMNEIESEIKSEKRKAKSKEKKIEWNFIPQGEFLQTKNQQKEKKANSVKQKWWKNIICPRENK